LPVGVRWPGELHLKAVLRGEVVQLATVALSHERGAGVEGHEVAGDDAAVLAQHPLAQVVDRYRQANDQVQYGEQRQHRRLGSPV
jgi:hypothetical protein